MGLKESQQKLMDMEAICAKYRGEFLESFVSLEYSIEEVVVIYFTSNHPVKSVELKHTLIGAELFSFSLKRGLIAFIAAKYPTFKKHKKFDGFLQEMAAFRNKIAHVKLIKKLETWNNFDGENVYCEIISTKDKKVKKDVMILNSKIIQKNIVIIKYLKGEVIKLHNLVIK